MRSIIILSLTFFFAIQASAQAINQKKQLRQQLIRAINNSSTTDSMYNSLTAMPIKSPVIVGYIGTLQALKAKHTWNPYSKMKQVANAEKTFEKAIKADPHNLELRYLRYSVEYNLPKILGQSKNMGADKQVMLEQIARKRPNDDDRELVINVINYLLQNGDHTVGEKTDLHKQLVALK